MDFAYRVHYPQIHNTGIDGFGGVTEAMDLDRIYLEFLVEITAKQVLA